MTSTSTGVRADATVLGLTFTEQGFTLPQFARRLDDLTTTIALVSSQPIYTDTGEASLLMTEPDVVVQSASIQSPLEIWLTISYSVGAGAGATMILADRLVRIYSQISRARADASLDRLNRTLNEQALEFIVNELRGAANPEDLAAAVRVVVATRQVTVVSPFDTAEITVDSSPELPPTV